MIARLIHFQLVRFTLFELILLLKQNILSPESALFTKLPISLLVAKFACFNLLVKISVVNLLNSGVVMYLS